MSQEEKQDNPLAEIVAAHGGRIPTPEELAERRAFDEIVRSIDDVGDYVPEEEDPNVLIYGPWLERGGSAFWVSTAGTGKSIGSFQLAHAMSMGRPFCGLRPRGRLKFWIFQSEDSERRNAQDRIDVRAELAELYGDEDTAEAWRGIKLIKLTGKVGTEFLNALGDLLTQAEGYGVQPDVIILNPFLAFVGGPITDGAYVTPFLRGGMIDGEHTCGLQSILERHGVGALIYHHTPKPPTDSELDKWMKSAFPEYQGAGSSDITNWGRSFVTMMKVKDHPNMVCVTAGKNGAELGWERIGGAFRRYMAFSAAEGVSGKGRHAWRDLTPEEYAEVVGKEKQDDERMMEDAVSAIVTAIKAAEVAPIASARGIEPLIATLKIKRTVVRTACAQVLAKPDAYHLTVRPILHSNGVWRRHIGLAENLVVATLQASQERKMEGETA